MSQLWSAGSAWDRLIEEDTEEDEPGKGEEKGNTTDPPLIETRVRVRTNPFSGFAFVGVSPHVDSVSHLRTYGSLFGSSKNGEVATTKH